MTRADDLHDESGSTMKHERTLGDYARFVRPHWSDDELDRLSVVAGFLQALRAKDFDRLLSEYGDHPYVQHNVGMETGTRGVEKEGRRAASRFPQFAIEPKHVYVDGEFVIVQAHMTTNAAHRGDDSKGLNVVDIWKVSDGKIVEHWDAIQPLDFGARLFSLFTGGAVNNSNGRF